LVILVIV